MKKIMIIAAFAVVSACSKEAPAPEAAATTEAAAATPAAEVMAADGKSPVGKFKITEADGTVIMEEAKADGTYVDTDASGKVVETGTWVQKSPDHFCFTKEGAGSKEKCTTEAVDAKGVWTAQVEGGKTSTVERVES
jgi:hypothetical protein